MWLRMRTAREKPMMGSKEGAGDVGAFVMRLDALWDWSDQARLLGSSVDKLFHSAESLLAGWRFRLPVLRVFRGLGRELPAAPHGVARSNVLGTVPVEGFDVDEEDSLYDVGLVDGAE